MENGKPHPHCCSDARIDVYSTMRRHRRNAALAFLATLVAVSFSTADQMTDRDQKATVPPKAIEVYRYVIAHRSAPSGHVGGRIFRNREKNLPPGGNYHEFDVNPKVRGRNRGAERIVVDYNTGKGWYTRDHYRTFIPIPRGP